jgi:hypothetical protein
LGPEGSCWSVPRHFVCVIQMRNLHKRRLNMELSSISKVSLGSCVQLYSLAETSRNSLLPLHLGSFARALLVIQDRRHLFMTPVHKRLFSAYDTLQYGVPRKGEKGTSNRLTLPRNLSAGLF